LVDATTVQWVSVLGVGGGVRSQYALECCWTQAVVAVRRVSVPRSDDDIELVLCDRGTGPRCFHLQIHRI